MDETEQETPVDAELDVMKTVIDTLKPFDHAARVRIMAAVIVMRDDDMAQWVMKRWRSRG